MMNDELFCRIIHHSSFNSVSPKSPERSIFKIGQILLVVEGFAFKTYVAVSFVMITVLEPANQILDSIPEIEWQNAQFGLLPQMNSLVVEQGRNRVRFSHQNERKQRHTVGAKGRNVDDKHGCDFYTHLTRNWAKVFINW